MAGNRDRVQRVLERYRSGGPGAVASRVGEVAAHAIYLHEEHVWYVLDLAKVPSELPDTGGVDVQPVGPDLVPLVAELGQNVHEARARHANGAELWMSLRDEHVLFACWIFRDRAPVLAAPGGALELPTNTVVQEDSVVTPAARGLGVAVQLGLSLYFNLAASGVQTVLTKIATDNLAARKAAAKVGFQELATVGLTRKLGRKHIVLVPAPDANRGLADELVKRLTP